MAIPTEVHSPDAVPGLENDAEGARLVREELKLLAIVQRALDAATAAEGDAAKGRLTDDARLLELRDDVAVAKPEDLPALFEQMHHLGALRAQRGKGALGNVDRGNPYFGHLRLEEAGKRRDVLIGSRSYVDARAGVRIVDWRHAPVSRIFYRYAEGDDYEEQLGDRTVDGVVLARRSVAIAGGQLVRVAGPQGTFARGADGVWARVDVRAARLVTSRREGVTPPPVAVGAGADKHLPAIAALLDAAQFELIARPGAGLVAVQGSAGSGKTTVGLHRVAYLAFTDPQRFRADRMMVVVPNDALVHYVDRVLPQLGVEGVPVTTFNRWGPRLLASLLPKLTPHVSEETPAVVSRAKSHPAMLRGIEAVVQRAAAAMDAKLRGLMAKWPSGNVVVQAWEKTAGESGRVAPELRVTALSQWLAGKRTIDGTSATIPDVTRGALERLLHELKSQARGVMGIWDELLTSREQLASTFESTTLGPHQLDQVHAWCLRQARVRAEGERDGETPTLDGEDVALLLRTWQVLRGPLHDVESRPIRYAHLFVDEVQDASAVELRVLIDLTGKDRCVTLAGDTAQRMLDEDSDAVEFDWNGLLDDLDVPHTTIEPLKVSYRSTTQITAFARRVLGPLAHEAEPIATRQGPSVELFTFGSPGETVAWMADALRQLARDEPDANVALIARFPQQAELYYDGLVRAEVPNVRRVAKQDFTWDAGFDVTDVRQTKGLEFDEVILLETSATSYPLSPQARRALYVGATRAAHQLWCVASDKPSALVTEALAPAPP